jgi:hypothetical protein
MKLNPCQIVGCFASLVLIALANAGCGLTKPNSASFASVKIKDSTPEKIIAATVAVFMEDGYTTVAATTTGFIFVQEGSRMNKFAYGDWVGGGSVYVRVRGEIVPLTGGEYRLQCTAYMVQDYGTIMEDEQRLANIRSHPWQRLLDKVKDRLKD